MCRKPSDKTDKGHSCRDQRTQRRSGTYRFGAETTSFLPPQGHRNPLPYKLRCLLEEKQWAGGNMKDYTFNRYDWVFRKRICIYIKRWWDSINDHFVHVFIPLTNNQWACFIYHVQGIQQTLIPAFPELSEGSSWLKLQGKQQQEKATAQLKKKDAVTYFHIWVMCCIFNPMTMEMKSIPVVCMTLLWLRKVKNDCRVYSCLGTKFKELDILS